MLDRFTARDAIQRHPVIALFARRPVTVTVLLTAFTVLGLIALKLLPLELFPAGLESRSISVSVPISGAGNVQVSPEMVERDVTLIVEGELATISGIETLNATSRRNGADFDLEFVGSVNINEAYAQVMDALERARLRLPSDLGRITVRKGRFGTGFPHSFVNFYWESGVRDPHLKLERIIQPRLEAIDGVSGVAVSGVARKFIAVDIDQELSRALGVNLQQLLARLRGDNFREPAGRIQGAGKELYLVADSRFGSLEEMRGLVVRPGLTLGEIATVSEQYSVDRYLRVNGKAGASVSIYKASDANTVDVGDRLNAAIEEIRRDSRLQGFSVMPTWNQGDSIRESIGTLLGTLVQGAICAIVVLLLFLKSFRLALVISLSIPAAMLMCLATMYFLGQTLNLLTLMGLTLAGGMLLDNAIVVAENIFRRGRLGDEPLGAAIRGAGEVGLALALSTATTVIVFVAVVFLSNSPWTTFVMGKIGLPVCLSLLFSILTAVFVIPLAMASFGLAGEGKPHAARRVFFDLRLRLGRYWREGSLWQRLWCFPVIVLWELAAVFIGRKPQGESAPVVNWLRGRYAALVRRIIPLRYGLLVLVIAGTVAGIGACSGALTQTDQNQGNRDRINLSASFPRGSSLRYARAEGEAPQPDLLWARWTLTAERLLIGRPVNDEDEPDWLAKRTKALAEGMSFADAVKLYGRTPDEAREYYGIDTLSVSFSERRASFSISLQRARMPESKVLLERMREALPESAGVEIFGEFQGGSSSNSEVSLVLRGPDTRRLVELAEEVARRLASIRGLEGVRIDQDEALEEIQLTVERQRATAMGVSPETLAQVISFNIGGTSLSDYQRGEDLIPLRVRFAPPRDATGAYRDPGLSDVAEVRVPGEGGGIAAKAMTATSGLAGGGFSEIRRINRQTSLRVVGTTSSEDLERIREEVEAVVGAVTFPPGYSREYGGRFRDFSRGMSDQMDALKWAVLLVFLVMCFLFESLLLPVSILAVSLPGALLGGWGLMVLTNTPNDQISALGLVVLAGVVVNNGIIQVDLINRLRSQGVARLDAVVEGCSQRLRPILMTTLTTTFGLIPMAIGDSSFVGTPYYPMGRVMLGGMALSMVYTLLFVPLAYLAMDDFGAAVRAWVGRLMGAKAEHQPVGSAQA
ncbi:MAG: efflux RND transporter permease subunit [Planctomycetes bacterium]|nr:efflux RND transporter permease subunit [Planctomycetota bacterium]